MNDIICHALKAGVMPAILEPVGLNCGDGKRPDGISVSPFSQGRSLCWDATCMKTYAESSIFDSSVKAGAAAVKAEVSKRTKYPELVRRFRFEPIAIETSGVLPHDKNNSPGDRERISQLSGDKRETMWLKQRLSMAI